MRPPGRFFEAIMDTREVPYALVWFNGTQVPMNEHQFKQAVRDGALCRCRNCLACRAYAHSNEDDIPPTERAERNQ